MKKLKYWEMKLFVKWYQVKVQNWIQSKTLKHQRLSFMLYSQETMFLEI